MDFCSLVAQATATIIAAAMTPQPKYKMHSYKVAGRLPGRLFGLCLGSAGALRGLCCALCLNSDIHVQLSLRFLTVFFFFAILLWHKAIAFHLCDLGNWQNISSNLFRERATERARERENWFSSPATWCITCCGCSENS